MLKPKASLAFLRLLAAKKIPFGANVINCLTANAKTFADVPVPVDTLTVLNNNLSNALQNVEDGGKQARAAYKTALAAWNEAFENTANYISLIANGDVQVITNSGFNATKSNRQPVVMPGTCKNFHAIATKASGIVNVSSDAVATSHGYITIATPDEGVTVTQTGNQLSITAGGVTTTILISTRSKAQLENMPSGKLIYLSIMAFNAGGAGPLTNGQQVIPQ